MKHADKSVLRKAKVYINASNPEKLQELLEDSKDVLGTLFDGGLFIKRCSDEWEEAKSDLASNQDDEDFIYNEESAHEMFNLVKDETIKLAIHTGDTEILEYMENSGIGFAKFSDNSSAKQYAMENGNKEIKDFYIKTIQRRTDKIGKSTEALHRQGIFAEQLRSRQAQIEFEAERDIAQNNTDLLKSVDVDLSKIMSSTTI